jgi:hypothetical protein
MHAKIHWELTRKAKNNHYSCQICVFDINSMPCKIGYLKLFNSLVTIDITIYFTIWVFHRPSWWSRSNLKWRLQYHIKSQNMKCCLRIEIWNLKYPWNLALMVSATKASYLERLSYQRLFSYLNLYPNRFFNVILRCSRSPLIKPLQPSETYNEYINT